MDRDIPVYDIRTMESVIQASIAPRKFTMVLLAIFSGLALVLAAIGLYGVIPYSVARRTQEIGLRMAVGAGMRDIFALIVRQGMTLALIGAAIGVGAAIGLTRFLASLLYGVRAIDPISLSIVPMLLLAVAFIACAVPALTATRVNPLRALRHD